MSECSAEPQLRLAVADVQLHTSEPSPPSAITAASRSIYTRAGPYIEVGRGGATNLTRRASSCSHFAPIRPRIRAKQYEERRTNRKRRSPRRRDFTQELPRQLLPTRAKDPQGMT
jgi:hypothetical protein